MAELTGLAVVVEGAAIVLIDDVNDVTGAAKPVGRKANTLADSERGMEQGDGLGDGHAPPL